jgi:hypothetical protein
MEPVAEAPQTSSEPPADPFQEQVLTLLQSMTASIAKLNERVDTVEQSAGPKFVPMTERDYGNTPDAHERYQLAQAAPTDAVPRSKTIPVTADGLRIPDAFVDEHPARFGPEMRVQLNLDAVPHGRNDGRTRGELMAEQAVPNGPGVIIDRTYLTKVKRADGRRGVWKYRCKFPQVVMPGSALGIVSLHEHELLPA